MLPLLAIHTLRNDGHIFFVKGRISDPKTWFAKKLSKKVCCAKTKKSKFKWVWVLASKLDCRKCKNKSVKILQMGLRFPDKNRLAFRNLVQVPKVWAVFIRASFLVHVCSELVYTVVFELLVMLYYSPGLKSYN